MLTLALVLALGALTFALIGISLLLSNSHLPKEGE